MIKAKLTKMQLSRGTNQSKVNSLLKSKYLFDLQDIKNPDKWIKDNTVSKLSKNIDVMFVQFDYDDSNSYESTLYEILLDFYYHDIKELRKWFNDIAPGEYRIDLNILNATSFIEGNIDSKLIKLTPIKS